MNKDNRSKTDQILDLLLEALLERQASRAQPEEGANEQLPVIEPVTAVQEPEEPATALGYEPTAAEPDNDLLPSVDDVAPTAVAWKDLAAKNGNGDEVEDKDWSEDIERRPQTAPTESLAPIQLDQMLRRLAVVMVLLIILVNIPFNRSGLSLARAMPDAQSLIIRDGLVLKGSGEAIYVLENNQKRWITTLEAFAWHGYRWEQVNIVDDAFLNRFADGRPIYVLLKCSDSPHIYALESGQKRWIKDIPTFESEGFVWEDIKFISCAELRRMPTGIPIPPDAGPSPEP